jgi:hypothetical protein
MNRGAKINSVLRQEEADIAAMRMDHLVALCNLELSGQTATSQWAIENSTTNGLVWPEVKLESLKASLSAASRIKPLLSRLTQNRFEAVMATVSVPIEEGHVIILHIPVGIHHRSVGW